MVRCGLTECHVENDGDGRLEEDESPYSWRDVSIVLCPEAHDGEEGEDGEAEHEAEGENALAAIAIVDAGEAEDLEETVADAVDGEAHADGCWGEAEAAEGGGGGEENGHYASVCDVDEGDHGVV